MHVSATVHPTAIYELFCMLFVAQPSLNAFCIVYCMKDNRCVDTQVCMSACVYVCVCADLCDTGEALRVLFDSLICKYVFIKFLIMYYTIM